jgi:hypothetical protein
MMRIAFLGIALLSIGLALAPVDRAALTVDDSNAAAIYGGDCTNKSSLSKCPTPKEEPKCKATQCYDMTTDGVERGIFTTYCTGDSQLNKCSFVFRTAEVCQTTTTNQ